MQRSARKLCSRPLRKWKGVNFSNFNLLNFFFSIIFGLFNLFHFRFVSYFCYYVCLHILHVQNSIYNSQKQTCYSYGVLKKKKKSELMVLGFISLLLTFGQSYIAKICIPEKAANTMLPCNLQKKSEEEHDAGRRLLWDLATNSSTRRALASDVPSSCSKVSIISQKCCHFGISRSYDLCNYVIAIPQLKYSHIRYKKRVGAVYNSTHETIK